MNETVIRTIAFAYGMLDSSIIAPLLSMALILITMKKEDIDSLMIKLGVVVPKKKHFRLLVITTINLVGLIGFVTSFALGLADMFNADTTPLVTYTIVSSIIAAALLYIATMIVTAEKPIASNYFEFFIIGVISAVVIGWLINMGYSFMLNNIPSVETIEYAPGAVLLISYEAVKEFLNAFLLGIVTSIYLVLLTAVIISTSWAYFNEVNKKSIAYIIIVLAVIFSLYMTTLLPPTANMICLILYVILMGFSLFLEIYRTLSIEAQKKLITTLY